MTEEHKRKICIANSIALKGKKLSDETKRKIGLAHKGNKHALGSRHTEEWKRAQSTRSKDRFDRIGRRTPEQRRAIDRTYWAAHKDKKREKDARTYAKHRIERQATAAIYQAAHREEAVKRVNLWRTANRAHCNTISANRRAREAKAEGSHTTGEWENVKAQYGHRCKSCGKHEPEIKLTRDHIIPLARGGSNYIENIQPLCGKCNCRKHAKMPGTASLE